MDAPKPCRRWADFLQSLLAPLAAKHYDPETLRLVPSWGVSVLLHGLLLLILAFFIRAGRPAIETRAIESQLGSGESSDLTSLVEASQAGDPFTNE